MTSGRYQAYNPSSAASGPDLQPPPSSIQAYCFLTPGPASVQPQPASLSAPLLSPSPASVPRQLRPLPVSAATTTCAVHTPYIHTCSWHPASLLYATSTRPHRHKRHRHGRTRRPPSRPATETRPSSGNPRPTSSSLFPRSDHKPAGWPRPADYPPAETSRRKPPSRCALPPVSRAQGRADSPPEEEKRPLTNGTGQDNQPFLPSQAPFRRVSSFPPSACSVPQDSFLKEPSARQSLCVAPLFCFLRRFVSVSACFVLDKTRKREPPGSIPAAPPIDQPQGAASQQPDEPI